MSDAHAHPLVRRLFALMDEHKVTYRDLGEKAGIDFTNFAHWRNRSSPSVPNLEAALNALGYGLHIQPIGGGRPRKHAQR